MIIRTFDLYLNAGASIAPVIHVNQYDQNESWIFTLYQEDGSAYTVSQESEAAIVGLKSDMHSILNAAEVNENGQVVVTETQQMTAAAGQAIFEVLIDAGQHGTANFVVDVEPRPGDDVVPSESDLSLLQQAIEACGRAEEAADTAEDYAGAAITAASTASTKASEASLSASAASGSATTASTAADASAASKLVSEGYANGQQNGQDVSEESPYYHNNSKYWSDLAQSSEFQSIGLSVVDGAVNLTYTEGA